MKNINKRLLIAELHHQFPQYKINDLSIGKININRYGFYDITVIIKTPYSSTLTLSCKIFYPYHEFVKLSEVEKVAWHNNKNTPHQERYIYNINTLTSK